MGRRKKRIKPVNTWSQICLGCGEVFQNDEPTRLYCHEKHGIKDWCKRKQKEKVSNLRLNALVSRVETVAKSLPKVRLPLNENDSNQNNTSESTVIIDVERKSQILRWLSGLLGPAKYVILTYQEILQLQLNDSLGIIKRELPTCDRYSITIGDFILIWNKLDFITLYRLRDVMHLFINH